jgi:hypothetical protein
MHRAVNEVDDIDRTDLQPDLLETIDDIIDGAFPVIGESYYQTGLNWDTKTLRVTYA